MRPTLATAWRWLGVAALAATFALPAQAQRTVTLRLNTATLPDTLQDNALAGVQVRGCLDGCTGDQSPLPDGNVIAWNDNTTLLPTNVGGDYWDVSFQIPDNQALIFKFFAQQSETLGIGGWEDGENTNLPAGTGDVTLDLHYFNKTGATQPYDWRPFEAPGDSVGVWFRVYMNTEDAVTKGYDPADAGLVVALRGNFGERGGVGAGGPIADWGGENARLTRESTDSGKPGYHLFSGLVKYPASAVGQVQNYKFYFLDSNTTGDAGYENDINGGNRSFTIPAADSTLYWQYYSNSPPVSGSVVTSQVAFLVDIEPLVNVRVFNTQRGDSLQLRGGFNGWDCPDGSDDCEMTAIPGSFEYAVEFPITAVQGSTQNYKYFVDFGPTEYADIGWEEPLDTGGGNRVFSFDGTPEQTVGPEFYNSVRPGNVIPDGQGVNVTFRVDMDRAEAFPVNPFDPAADTVKIQLEDPIWRLTQGFAPGDPRVSADGLLFDFILTDPDGNGVYEGTLPITGPTYNGIGYRYVYVKQDGTTVVEGRSTFEAGRRRYRYILPDGGGTFPQAFTFAYDAFRTPGTSGDLLIWEYSPTDPNQGSGLPGVVPPGTTDPLATAAEPVGGELPTTASLRQNYPNPFNPTTTIEYALPQSGHVSLAIFDVTGRRVATLVDGVQAANTYRVGFDASGLASGVYVYQLRTAGTVLTQRMTILK